MEGALNLLAEHLVGYVDVAAVVCGVVLFLRELVKRNLRVDAEQGLHAAVQLGDELRADLALGCGLREGLGDAREFSEGKAVRLAVGKTYMVGELERTGVEFGEINFAAVIGDDLLDFVGCIGA